MTAERYEAGALRRLAEDLLTHAGMPADKAQAVADVLVDGDLLGHATHGLQLLPGYLEHIRDGLMTLDGEPEVLADHAAVATWDARRLPGAWVTLQAVDTASQRARQFGTGIVSVRHSHHIASLATYARRVAEAGQVLVLMSSAPSSASVAPYGGTRGLFSPSPLGVGIPASDTPVLVDVSTSITTNTMTSLLARDGRRLPHAWLNDEQGRPTDDPTVLVAPRQGTIQPLGGNDAGHKGYGLALMVEALTAGLAGHGRRDPGARLGATLYVQVIEPALFAGTEAFVEEMDWMVEQCRDNPPVDPARPVRLPGGRAMQLRADQLAHGVLLQPAILDGIQPWADAAGVSMPAAMG